MFFIIAFMLQLPVVQDKLWLAPSDAECGTLQTTAVKANKGSTSSRWCFIGSQPDIERIIGDPIRVTVRIAGSGQLRVSLQRVSDAKPLAANISEVPLNPKGSIQSVMIRPDRVYIIPPKERLRLDVEIVGGKGVLLFGPSSFVERAETGNDGR